MCKKCIEKMAKELGIPEDSPVLSKVVDQMHKSQQSGGAGDVIDIPGHGMMVRVNADIPVKYDILEKLMQLLSDTATAEVKDLETVRRNASACLEYFITLVSGYLAMQVVEAEVNLMEQATLEEKEIN